MRNKSEELRVRLIWVFLLSGLFLLVSPTVSRAAIDSIQTKNFVVKSYISLLNRKPNRNEIQEALVKYDLFKTGLKGKQSLIRDLLKTPEFSGSLFDLFRYEFLQGVDYEQIDEQIRDYQLLLSIKTQSDFADIFSTELNRYQKLRTCARDFQEGKTDYRDFHRAFFDNKFYDDNNMGDHNFVTSTFNYLFQRNPTRYELEQGKQMFNNQFGTLFTKPGESRSDYLTILFASAQYQEGQIRFWYNKLLNRNPTNPELFELLGAGQKFSIRPLIEKILLTPEFSGK